VALFQPAYTDKKTRRKSVNGNDYTKREVK
jgi:hypothetical protein